MMKLLLTSILMFFCLSTFADSIVYKCKNEKGRFVFQQVACDESNVTGNNDGQLLWRKMRTLSSEGKVILGALGADVESIKQCNRKIEFFNRKVNALEKDVARVSRRYPELYKAHNFLKDCGVCRTSAEANCRTADKYLERAVSKLTEY